MNILQYLFPILFLRKEKDYLQSQMIQPEDKTKGHFTRLGIITIICVCFMSFYIGWVYVYPSTKNYFYPSSNDIDMKTVSVSDFTPFESSVTFIPFESSVTVYDTTTGLHYDVSTTEDLSKCSLAELEQKRDSLRKQVLKEQLKVLKFQSVTTKITTIKTTKTKK